MANLVQLGTMRAQVRLRMDLGVSQFVTDAELNGYINAGLQELHDRLVGVDAEHLVTTYTTTINGAASYAMPADFYKLKKASWTDGSGYYYDMQEIAAAEKNRFSGPAFVSPLQFGSRGLHYYLLNTSVYVVPFLGSYGTMEVLYYPRAPTLTADSDTFDALNGFDEYVVADTCIKVAIKREDDPRIWFKVKSDIGDRVDAMAVQRDMNADQAMVIYPRGGRS